MKSIFLDAQLLAETPEPSATQRAVLIARVERAWHDKAACRSAAGDDWFPDAAQPTRKAQAVARCGRCPVRRSCLAFALSSGEQFGIWGGTTELQRAVLRQDLAAGRAVDEVLEFAGVRPSFEPSQGLRLAGAQRVGGLGGG